MATYDIVIMGGTVIDGLRTPRYKADVGIKDGVIAQIGVIDASEGAEVVDATGKIVAPGIVDIHTHYDSQLFWDPWCTMSAWHGVTTVVLGNCGFGFAPCRPEDQDRTMLSLSRNEAVPIKTMRAGMPWDWVSYPEFLDSVERTPKGVNVMSLVPLAPLYTYVVGIDKAKKDRASDEELARMCELLVEGMEAGGCGWSSQISGDLNNVQLDYDGSPMVTDMMTEREVTAFARALRKLGRGSTQITGQLETAALIARESGRPIIWNALAPTGSVNQHGESQFPHLETIRRLEELNAEDGLRVFASAQIVRFQSEIVLENYNLMDIFPAWKDAGLGTLEEKIAKFSDPERRPALKAAVDELEGGFGAARYPMAEITVNWITSDAHDALALKERYEGFTLGEIAERENKHLVDVLLDIAVAGDLNVGFGTTMIDMDTQAVREVASCSVALPGISDGGAHTKFVTTARFGTELLAHWVRDHEVMSLEEAHWRLSAYPAMAMGLRDRGSLAEGKPADVIVYDLDRLEALPQERLFDYPADEWRLVQKAVGYDRIIVNGRTTFVDGVCTDATPGKLLRHGRA
ncbi:amidohydrolase family protein [Frankia sp. AgB1.9]|uniref:N-acyl-D-amino-acid deacylase family protein n=1 Tax=unclassified Frankia TaxID=2632575 RepID=UPI0019318587|nr:MULTISPECIES: amidohydrolase family protein [unclassified Frankia]MBL7490434.1 amidohydrolase family protein [Frankia sp. AgW1.1]MBL7550070.1 amidohydrolase family protein [Frankia sp. AgB1.9]MBL7624619.1 amidohydrolase family protein [Frankia sp. AgB1.8]